MSIRSFHCHNLISLNLNSHDVINIITLCVILILALTVTHGQRSNFTISLPFSGLPFPLLAPHLSPRFFRGKLYKGDSGEFYCLPAPCFRRRHHCCTPCAPSSFCIAPRAQSLDAREASCTKEQDGQECRCELRNQLGTICFQIERSGESSSQWPHLCRRSGHFPYY
jgi:hypothetical protein